MLERMNELIDELDGYQCVTPNLTVEEIVKDKVIYKRLKDISLTNITIAIADNEKWVTDDLTELFTLISKKAKADAISSEDIMPNFRKLMEYYINIDVNIGEDDITLPGCIVTFKKFTNGNIDALNISLKYK